MARWDSLQTPPGRPSQLWRSSRVPCHAVALLTILPDRVEARLSINHDSLFSFLLKDITDLKLRVMSSGQTRGRRESACTLNFVVAAGTPWRSSVLS